MDKPDFSQFVPKYYRMNAETEDLLLDGSYLANGMVVIGDVSLRMDADETEDQATIYNIRRFNQWCTISNLTVDFSKGRVTFLATYADGWKVKLTLDMSYSWLVKKDSIPEMPARHLTQKIFAVHVDQFYEGDRTQITVITDTNGYEHEVIVPKSVWFTQWPSRQSWWANKGASTKATEKHDPAWATENLMKARFIEDDPFAKLKQDPNPTLVNIPIFVQPDPTEGPQDEMGVDTDVQRCTVTKPNMFSADITHACVKEENHEVHGDDLHKDRFGFTWSETKPPKDPKWMADGADDQPQD